MPLCLAGMHRSGTSMIAGLLQGCGLDLGSENDLLPPAPSNPDGFWENRSFLRVNDSFLKELGGSWDRPPLLGPAIWEDERRVRRFRNQAAKLARRFRRREPWGWKDPRNCLTLPLWRSVLPQTKVLICVRNPLAVAESLCARDGMSFAESFDLWLTYNRSALAAAPPEERIVTHYESYFLDPCAELRRVLESFRIPTAASRLERACARIKPSLVHHRVTMDELGEAGASAEVVQCYRDLCVEADRSDTRPRDGVSFSRDAQRSARSAARRG